MISGLVLFVEMISMNEMVFDSFPDTRSPIGYFKQFHFAKVFNFMCNPYVDVCANEQMGNSGIFKIMQTQIEWTVNSEQNELV